MPSVPRYGLPDVAANVQLPQQSINNPVPGALAQLGKTVSDNFERMQVQNAETTAVEKTNQFQDWVAQATLGEGGILTLQGKAAMEAAPVSLESIRTHARELMGDVNDPITQKMLDRSFGAIINSATQNIYAHTATERRTWIDSTMGGRVEVATATVGSHPYDVTQVRQNLESIKAAVQARGENAGWSPEQIEAETQKALSTAGQAWLNAQPVEDRIKLLTANQAPQVGTAAATMWDAIHMQESGGRAASPTSIDGAVGPGQIKPATFAQYAKPGEVITNSADNIAVGKRIIADYEARWPNDPARVATAYFSGPGNVAPAASSTPWLHNYQDGNGKYVSSYVSDVMGRLGTGSAVQPTPTDRMDTGTPIDGIGLPDRAALLYQYQAQARVDVAAQDRAERLFAQQSQDSLYTKFIAHSLDPKAPPLSVQDVMAAPGLDFGQRKQFVDMLSASAADIQTAPGLFNQLYQDIYRPAGDPRRIEDVGQLSQYVVSSQLAPKDLNTLRQQLGDRDKPGSETEQVLTKQLTTTARAQLVKSNLAGTPDPDGELHLQAFLTWYMQQRAARTAKGQSVTDWLNPANPDSPDKQIHLFTRPMKDIITDMAARMTQSVAPVSPLKPSPTQPAFPAVLRSTGHVYTWNPSRKQYRDETDPQHPTYNAEGLSVQ